MNESSTSHEDWPVLEWHEVAERLARQTFQIQGDTCSGTAFICGQGIEPESSLRHYILATAWHVVDDLLKEQDFILFRRVDSTAIKCINSQTMIARLGPEEFDLGLLFIRTADDVLEPDKMMPVRGMSSFPNLGDDLCWFGHPASLGTDPVFCRGTLACYRNDLATNYYLVNGPAYPGMSGGAVADIKGHVIGLVSQWWNDPNLDGGQGMLRVAPSVMVRHTLEDRMNARIIDSLPNHPH